MNSGTPKAWSDPIVDEIRQVREHYAATFGYDLQAIFHDLKSQEQSSRRTFTTYPARTASPTELPR
jgi:hypothetical protein